MNATAARTDPTAVSGRRIGGYVVDWIIFITVIPALVFFLTADLTQYTDGPTCRQLERSGQIDSSYSCARAEVTTTDDGVETTEYDTYVWKTSASLFAGAAAIAYAVVVLWILQGLTGATVGKLIFGIRTVNESGGPPGLGRQILRGIGGIADAIPFCLMPLLPLVGLITMLATKRHRRVGDMIASTYVVQASAAGAPVAEPEQAAPYGGPPPWSPTTSPPPGAPPMTGAAVPPAAAGYAAATTTPPPPQGWAPDTPTSTTPPPPAAAPPAPDAPTVVSPAPAPAPAETEAPPADAAETSTPADDATAVQPAVAAAPEPVPEPPAPEPSAPEPPAAEQRAPTEQAAAPANGPQWDPQRNAYIQWDDARRSWFIYDDAAGQWKPLT